MKITVRIKKKQIIIKGEIFLNEKNEWINHEFHKIHSFIINFNICYIKEELLNIF